MGRPGRGQAAVSLTRMRVLRHLVGAIGVVTVTAGLVNLDATAGAQSADACAAHTTYSSVGAAVAVRTMVWAPGRSLAPGADADLPGAQAAVDSVLGSKGFAGAPYASVVAENAGQADMEASDLPVFAVSEYPVTPEASNSTPAATVSAKSTERSSTAEATGGGPGSDQASAGRAVAKAAASCEGDGGLKATADTSADMIALAGVLRIGRVESHAVAERDGQGKLVKLDGTVSAEGVTVLGQAAAITDKGLVVGSSPTPLPADPLTEALVEAGITVRYIAAERDAERGEVVAPGVEVTITAPVPNGEPVTTSYVFGRALARTTLTPGDTLAPPVEDDAPPVVPDAATPDGPDLPTPALPTSEIAAPATGTGASPRPVATDRPPVVLPTAQIGNWSVAPAYSALGVGALLLLVWLLFEKIAVRFAWR